MLTHEPEVRSHIPRNTAAKADRCNEAESLWGQLILLLILGLVMLLRWLR